MIDKKKIYDSIFHNPKYKNLTYREIESIYKNALIGIDGIAQQEKGKVKYAYSPKKAVEYAMKYALNHNPAYPSYKGVGGDCANFISQALHAGGMPMIGSNAASLKSWFCRSRNKWDVKLISSTWRGASAFSQYWMANANGFKDFSSTSFENINSFRKVYDYAVRGDAISLLSSSKIAYHTLIVVDYNNGDLICAAHSDDSNNLSLLSEEPNGGVRVYKMS